MFQLQINRLYYFGTGSFIEVESVDDEPQTELAEASKPPSAQGEEEQIGPKKEKYSGASEGFLGDNSGNELLGIEPHEEAEKDADDLLNEWQDINLVIMLLCALTYCEGSHAKQLLSFKELLVEYLLAICMHLFVLADGAFFMQVVWESLHFPCDLVKEL